MLFAIGASGKFGTVRRAATPSMAGIDAIGTRFVDAAVNVFVEELNKRFWLDPDLVSNVKSGDSRYETTE